MHSTTLLESLMITEEQIVMHAHDLNFYISAQ